MTTIFRACNHQTFDCPVGVWVIEQRAIMLSATVRSPTVLMPPVLVNDNRIVSVVVYFSLKQYLKGKWHFWNQIGLNIQLITAITVWAICSVSLFKVRYRCNDMHLFPTGDRKRKPVCFVLEFTATITRLISVCVDPILNHRSWYPIMHTSNNF